MDLSFLLFVRFVMLAKKLTSVFCKYFSNCIDGRQSIKLEDYLKQETSNESLRTNKVDVAWSYRNILYEYGRQGVKLEDQLEQGMSSEP